MQNPLKALPLLAPLFLTSYVYAQPHLPSPSSTLWYTSPAKVAEAKNALWNSDSPTTAMNEALPIGNGRIGALVFGGTTQDRLILNDISLWTGGLNLSGGYDIKEFGSYQMFGDLLISSGETSAGETPKVQITSPSGQQPFFPSEGVAAANDANPATKWTVEHKGRPVSWQSDLGTPSVIALYKFASANDVPERDPQNWQLEGSLDGQKWTTLDNREGQPPFPKRGQTQSYRFTNTTAYRFYRITFQPNLAVPHFQVADITLGSGTAEPDVSDYRRELNLQTAVSRTTFTQKGVRHVREAFASFPNQVLVYRWSADKPGAVSGQLRLKGAHGETPTAQGNNISFAGTLANGLRYEAKARVLTRGGQVQSEGDGVQLKNCDEAVILMALGTNYAMNYETGYRGEMPPLQKQLDSAAALGYDKLKAAQLKDHGSLFDRINLNLGTSTQAQKQMPTDQRKVAASKVPDPEFDNLLFQYGRYLMISCSRPGGLPANLQGLWNDSNRPAWFADYHANINIQMNYWPAETTNLAECHVPLFDLIKSQIPAWRKATAASNDWKTPSGAMTTRGFAVRTSHNTMGGMGWAWDDTANAWYCQHLWEHYAFGGDKKYLRDTAYPIIKETVEFWKDHLKTLPDGRLVVPHGWSPEHGPREDGVSYSQQIVWDLFTNYTEAAAALGVDKEYAAKVSAMRDKLVGPKIGKWGQLQEWMEDKDDPNDHHRHTSNLFAIYPGRQLSPAQTPELAKAAKVSLDARGIANDSDVREWSFAWRTALYARLGDAENAYVMVQNLMSNRNTCLNMFGLHPPMQIDGNFGITAGIAEMLLQSQSGEIILLPAVPKAWATGSVTGLRARGGVTVDATWKDGQLIAATLTSDKGGPITVRCGTKTATLNLKAGTPVRLGANLKA